MTHIYDALLRIEKLYDCKTATDTANLLGMPKMTFFDNRRKALEDYKKIEQLKLINLLSKKLIFLVIYDENANCFNS